MQKTAGYLVADKDRRYLTSLHGRLYYGQPITLFPTRAAAVRVINRTRRIEPNWPELNPCHIDRVGTFTAAKPKPKRQNPSRHPLHAESQNR